MMRNLLFVFQYSNSSTKVLLLLYFLWLLGLDN